jgi:hypothetical protein
MLPQSSWIAAFLLIGFLVFITARGELPSYLSVLLGTAKSASPSTATNASASQSTINNSLSTLVSAGNSLDTSLPDLSDITL